MSVSSDIDGSVAWSIINAIPKEFLNKDEGFFTVSTPRDISLEFRNSGCEWVSSQPLSADALQVLELYGPLVLKEDWIMGQMGQSLDGRIATETGKSHYVTGDGDLLRLHRVRAISDAIVVGANTVILDDPRLTVRKLAGSNPARVILDPNLRIDLDRMVFNDSSARSILLHDEKVSSEDTKSDVEAVGLNYSESNGFDMEELVHVLKEKGFRRILVEGGGITVSRFLEFGCIDRMHVTVAPLIIGSGKPSFNLPPISSLDAAIRPVWRRFELGDDVLFDLDLKC